MTLTGAYDEQNIFAKILRGEAPAHVVHEDDQTLSFMDVFPQSRGHVLVVPKHACRNLIEAPPQILGPLHRRVQTVAQAVAAALQPDGVIVTQFNGGEAGQTVFHLHVHVIPRYAGEPMGRHGGEMADADELKALAAAISNEISPDS